MATLKDVEVGESCAVAALKGVGAVKRRIMDMGLTKGTEVHIHQVDWIIDVNERTVRGYELSIRKDEAASIEVEDVHKVEEA